MARKPRSEPEIPKYVAEWTHARVQVPDGRRGYVTQVTQHIEDHAQVLRCRVAIDDGPLWCGFVTELDRVRETS